MLKMAKRSKNRLLMDKTKVWNNLSMRLIIHLSNV
jgi:hypothetical protein